MSPYCPIMATLGYVLSKDGQDVLLIHRNKRPDDMHFGKYNGLGGKLQTDEDIVSCMKREIKEEAGIDALEVILRGTISWPGFGKGGEDWFGFVFRIDKWEGIPLTENPEGMLEWVPLKRLVEINLWESDRHWLDMVFEKSDRTFHGIAPFLDGKMVSWNCTSIGVSG